MALSPPSEIFFAENSKARAHWPNSNLSAVLLVPV